MPVRGGNSGDMANSPKHEPTSAPSGSEAERSRSSRGGNLGDKSSAGRQAPPVGRGHQAPNRSKAGPEDLMQKAREAGEASGARVSRTMARAGWRPAGDRDDSYDDHKGRKWTQPSRSPSPAGVGKLDDSRVAPFGDKVRVKDKHSSTQRSHGHVDGGSSKGLPRRVVPGAPDRSGGRSSSDGDGQEATSRPTKLSRAADKEAPQEDDSDEQFEGMARRVRQGPDGNLFMASQASCAEGAPPPTRADDAPLYRDDRRYCKGVHSEDDLQSNGNENTQTRGAPDPDPHATPTGSPRAMEEDGKEDGKRGGEVDGSSDFISKEEVEDLLEDFRKETAAAVSKANEFLYQSIVERLEETFRRYDKATRGKFAVVDSTLLSHADQIAVLQANCRELFKEVTDLRQDLSNARRAKPVQRRPRPGGEQWNRAVNLGQFKVNTEESVTWAALSAVLVPWLVAGGLDENQFEISGMHSLGKNWAVDFAGEGAIPQQVADKQFSRLHDNRGKWEEFWVETPAHRMVRAYIGRDENPLTRATVYMGKKVFAIIQDMAKRARKAPNLHLLKYEGVVAFDLQPLIQVMPQEGGGFKLAWSITQEPPSYISKQEVADELQQILDAAPRNSLSAKVAATKWGI